MGLKPERISISTEPLVVLWAHPSIFLETSGKLLRSAEFCSVSAVSSSPCQRRVWLFSNTHVFLLCTKEAQHNITYVFIPFVLDRILVPLPSRSTKSGLKKRIGLREFPAGYRFLLFWSRSGSNKLPVLQEQSGIVCSGCFPFAKQFHAMDMPAEGCKASGADMMLNYLNGGDDTLSRIWIRRSDIVMWSVFTNLKPMCFTELVIIKVRSES